MRHKPLPVGESTNLIVSARADAVTPSTQYKTAAEAMHMVNTQTDIACLLRFYIDEDGEYGPELAPLYSDEGECEGFAFKREVMNYIMCR